MATLKLETNTPREVVLQAFGGNGIFGKPEVSKKFFEPDGVTPQKQLRFSTTEGPLYLSEFAGMQINDQLQSLAIQPGDRIMLAKREVPVVGRKPVVKYFVERAAGATATPTPAAAANYQPPANGNGYHPPALPAKVPFDMALRGMIQSVERNLEGKQWSDACRQALVSTLFIQAGKDGVISWTALEPATSHQPAPTDLEIQLAASIKLAQQQKAQPPVSLAKVEPAAAPIVESPKTANASQFTIPDKKPWTTFKQMVEAFQSLKGSIHPNWPLYYKTLGKFGVEHANQLKDAKTAWACYQELAREAQAYLNPAEDSYAHYEQQEGGWNI
jgi:hypothetical protein